MKEGLRKDRMQAIVFLVLSIAFMVYSVVNHYSLSVSWIMSPYLFPLLIGAFLLLLSITFIYESNRKIIEKTSINDNYLSKASENNSSFELNDKSAFLSKYKKVFFTTIIIMIYYFLMPYVGFIIGTIAFLTILFIFLGERRWWLILLLSFLTTFLIELIFSRLLHVMLP